MNDQAGVAGTLAKYQSKMGHFVCVVAKRGYDPYGQQEFYGINFVGLRKSHNLLLRTWGVLWFYCYVSWCAWHFDVVHIHSQYLICLFLPFKAKILEFHGTDVRGSPSKRWAVDVAVTKLFLKLYGGG